ncbi:MAG: multidrug effflux MFS transporter [Alistipes sp.]|nr:multidrug effflux MFS transporter [Alistipes sp.]
MEKHEYNSHLYLLIVVGTLGGLAPFVTDFYLPAMPALVEWFSSSISVVQVSLAACLAGIAVGQLVLGPLSDRFGRKRVLMLSIAVYCLATAACIWAPTARAFLLCRLLQGLSAAGGVVISRSVASDVYSGDRLNRFFAMLSVVQGISPVCAPVLGGVMLSATDWRGIFAMLLLLGLALAAALVFFRETLPVERRQSGGVVKTFAAYAPVLRNVRFMYLVAAQALAMGVMFAYIAASPFIFQEHFGLSPLAYSLCFGLNACGIMAGSIFATRMGSAERALNAGARCLPLCGAAVVAMLLFVDSVVAVETSLFLMLMSIGVILPPAATLAMECEPGHSGVASAVIGFVMFMLGGVVSPLVGLGDMLVSTAAVIAVCCMAAFVAIRRSVVRACPATR